MNGFIFKFKDNVYFLESRKKTLSEKDMEYFMSQVLDSLEILPQVKTLVMNSELDKRAFKARVSTCVLVPEMENEHTIIFRKEGN